VGWGRGGERKVLLTLSHSASYVTFLPQRALNLKIGNRGPGYPEELAFGWSREGQLGSAKKTKGKSEGSEKRRVL
jgi:hypothetical protein